MEGYIFGIIVIATFLVGYIKIAKHVKSKKINKMTFFRRAVAIVVIFTTLIAIFLGLNWIEETTGTTNAFIVSLILIAAASYTIRNI